MAEQSPPTRLVPPDDVSAALWMEVGRLASEVLPEGWTLVGGLMVQLHAFEHGLVPLRATTDIDVLGDARNRRQFERIVARLGADGFVLHPPSPDHVAHRWEREGLIVDLLAPDGLREPARIDGQLRTVQIPGGTQALVRTEVIAVEIEGEQFLVRRPRLLGAILIKARALIVHADPDAQRADLLVLLSLLEDPRSAASELRGNEASWLRRCEGTLTLADAQVKLPPSMVRRALGALRLLTGAAGT